jgi:hypothetical protein
LRPNLRVVSDVQRFSLRALWASVIAIRQTRTNSASSIRFVRSAPFVVSRVERARLSGERGKIQHATSDREVVSVS